MNAPQPVDPTPEDDDRRRWVEFLDTVELSLDLLGPEPHFPMIVRPSADVPLPVDLGDRARHALRRLEQAQATVEVALVSIGASRVRLDHGTRARSVASPAMLDTRA